VKKQDTNEGINICCEGIKIVREKIVKYIQRKTKNSGKKIKT
jgi:hypothetical protein